MAQVTKKIRAEVEITFTDCDIQEILMMYMKDNVEDFEDTGDFIIDSHGGITYSYDSEDEHGEVI